MLLHGKRPLVEVTVLLSIYAINFMVIFNEVSHFDTICSKALENYYMCILLKVWLYTIYSAGISWK